MIPRVLELQNFLSYGPTRQHISFVDHQLICFSGRNGNGKSALLDAMTWALWGMARKTSGTSRADEGLLHIGQSHMLVSFEFYAQERVYRVRREFAKTYGKNYSALDFELFDVRTKEFISLTDKTIRKTQDAIVEAIGLDFDTFTNSVFLRQGQSNEFSKKSPKERKQILASILGLHRFDELKARALEQCREAIHKRSTTQAMRDHTQKELDDNAHIKQDLVRFKKQHDEVMRQLSACEKKRRALHKVRDEIKRCAAEYHQCQQRCAQLESDEKRVLDAARNIREQWKKVHGHYLRAWRSSDTRYQRELYQREREMSAKAREVVACKERYMELTTAWQQRARVVEQELSHKQRVLAEQLNEYEQMRSAQFEKRRAYYQLCIQRSVDAQRHVDHIETRLEKALRKQHAVCGLCLQLLDSKHAAHVRATLEKERAWFLHRLHRLSRILEKLRTQLTASTISEQEHKIHAELKRLKAQQKNLSTSDSELVRLEQECTRCERAIKKVAYDKKAHDALIKQLRALEGQQQIDRDRKAIEEKCQYIKQQMWQAIHMLRQIRTQLTEVKKQRDDLDSQHSSYKKEERTLAPCEPTYETLTKQKDEIIKTLGQLEAQRARQAQLTKTLEEHKKQLGTLEQDVEDYTDLAKMFGQDGIQALLIEEALPEIEQEANMLLAHLSDSGTQVSIRSLRDLKRGGVRETLDIDICDSAGTRPYELFSGGEAFRIDFALRIAISKLLARRAGTTLHTLIIDEGFGSQDEEGLSRLQDALYLIRRDFAKIIVVSHLPAFKESFPVHFVIDKQPTGSKVVVLERG